MIVDLIIVALIALCAIVLLFVLGLRGCAEAMSDEDMLDFRNRKEAP